MEEDLEERKLTKNPNFGKVFVFKQIMLQEEDYDAPDSPRNDSISGSPLKKDSKIAYNDNTIKKK